MRVISVGEGNLLTALYEGMFEQPMWHGFLSGLMAHTLASCAALVFRSFDSNEVVELSAGVRLPRRVQRLLVERQDQPPTQRGRMREGRVYALDEIVDVAERSTIDEVLAPTGIRHLRSVRITEPSGVEAWLTIAGIQDFRAADTALLANLAPHVRIALRSFVALEKERFHSSVASQAFGRLNFGWLTLDAGCRIIDMTPNMQPLFQRTSILRRGRYDRLVPASPAVDRAVTALVKDFAQGTHSQPRAINLSRDPWMDMLVTPVQRTKISGALTPVAIAYVSGDRQSQADRHEQLIGLFGLLPSEARLAWQLAQGTSIADAAAMVGIAEETARSYSKKIYAKTGARGQPELVRIILTSVLAIA